MIGVVERGRSLEWCHANFVAYTLHVNLPEMGEILEREFESRWMLYVQWCCFKYERYLENISGCQSIAACRFYARKGEIHALMGENGAGKSTPIKVLTGVHSLDGGEVRIAGSVHRLSINPRRMPRATVSVPCIRKLIFVRICQWRRTFLSDVSRESLVLLTGIQWIRKQQSSWRVWILMQEQLIN